MLKNKISKPILLAIMIFTLSFTAMPIMFAKATTNPVPPGCELIDFEDGAQGSPYYTGYIRGHYPGLYFHDNWFWIDRNTGMWNYPIYWMNGHMAANTIHGPDGTLRAGRIDFTTGPAFYFSILVATNAWDDATYDYLHVTAYDSAGNPIGDSGGALPNIHTGTMTQLTIETPGMAYVIVTDHGGYWWIDDLVWGSTIFATINFDPDTLNQKSMGKWVTVYIDFPGTTNVNEIDVDTILLNGVLGRAIDSPTDISDDDQILMVKFDRAALIGLVDSDPNVQITISGELNDGTPFEGSDTISVIH